MLTNLRKYIAITPRQFAAFLSEYIGTLMIAFAVAMSGLQFVISEGQLQSANQLLSIFAPMVIGATLALAIYAFRSYGGTNFNPAVTLALFVSGEIGIRRLVAYVLAQLAGAYSALILVKAIYAGDKFGFNSFETLLENLTSFGLTTTSIAILEAIGAFVLVLAAVSMYRQRQNNLGPVLVGVAYALGIFFTQQFTFGIINPAVAVSMNLPALYWISPLLGGVIAAIVLYILSSLNKEVFTTKTDKKHTHK